MTNPTNYLRTKRFKLCAHPGFHCRVFLWERSKLAKWYNQNGSYPWTKETGACYFFYPNPTNGEIAQIHLVKTDWGVEFLAHELSHLATRFLQHFNKADLAPWVLKQLPLEGVVLLDEAVALSIGRLHRDIYRWLWKVYRWDS